jgi:hypothetical protein
MQQKAASEQQRNLRASACGRTTKQPKHRNIAGGKNCRHCRRKFHGVVGTSKRATRAAGTFDSSAVKNSRF